MERDIVNIKTGRIKWREDFYRSKKWRKVRDDVMRRDNFICQYCLNGYHNEDGLKLIDGGKITEIPLGSRRGVVHHIIPLHLPLDDFLNIDPENLILVCHNCHAIVHNVLQNKAYKKETVKQQKKRRALNSGAALI